MMNNEKEKDAIDASKLDEILPKYEPIKLSGKNLAQNYVSAFNTGMNIYQCINYLQGNIDWTINAVNDVVKSWNTEVSESIDQSKAIARETTTEQFNTEWTNKQPELIEQVNNLTTEQFNKEKSIFSDEINSLKNYVTPQMFGAHGDGATDDTKSLQDCFEYAYDNKLPVFIPSGIYNHTGLTIKCADFGNSDYVPIICGNGRSNTILKHIGTGVGVSLTSRNNISYINGIIIKGLALNGNTNTTIGLELHEGTRIEIDNINITNASVAGIKQAQNFWVSSLTNIYIGDCKTGIDITGNSVTSIFYNMIYVFGSTASAYHLTGIYSEVGILCADHCTGDNVYNFDSFSGTIDSIGCENCNVSTLFRFRGSTCSVNSVYAWMPVLDGTLKTPILCSESMITITALNISGTTGVTSEIPLAKMYYAYLTIDNLNNGYLFSKPIPTVEGNTSALTINGVKIRVSSYRAYLGTDRCLPSDLLKNPFDKTKMGVAIYTSCTKNPSYLADGTDVRWNTPVRNGDWFIENDPAQYNVAGYVIMQDYNDEVGDAKRGCIPLLLSGSSANRPTKIPIGGMFFDTTLGKPIWYNGSAWVDAVGNTV